LLFIPTPNYLIFYTIVDILDGFSNFGHVSNLQDTNDDDIIMTMMMTFFTIACVYSQRVAYYNRLDF